MGEIEAAALAALERAKANAEVNAFIHIDDAGVVEQAKALDSANRDETSPVYGMLLAVKDIIHVKGMPNSAGTPGLKRFVPADDNPVVETLKNQGALVLGKTNMHELAFGITSNNTGFGAVRNPVDLSLMAGGSSGGTAAAIAADIVDAGLGTDTGGSVRIPAALTGTVGFRPTLNRYPVGSITPISKTRDTIGPMAKNVATVISLDSAIMGEPNEVATIKLSDIRLGFVRDYYYRNLDAETSAVAEAALARLSGAGVDIVEVEFPGLADSLAATSFPIALYEFKEELPVYLKRFNVGVSMDELRAQLASQDVIGLFGSISGDGAIPEDVYKNALVERQKLAEQFDQLLANKNLCGLIFPTTILPARPIEGSDEQVVINGSSMPTFAAYIQNTDPASITGTPGISLPAGTTESGLPVGMEIDGARNSDRELLAIALALEATLNP